jgi:LemA protein
MNFGTILIVLIVIVVLVVLVGVMVYNTLIGMKVAVKEAFSDMDVQLKRRYDLIPNLVNTVKGAANFETSTLEKVIQARNQAVSIQGMSSEKMQAENQLSGALRQLFALSESYPDLKANASFMQLQQQLEITEDKILSSRRFYNSTVKSYNAYQMQFPAVLFRSIAGAKEELFFELENPTEERKSVKVEF